MTDSLLNHLNPAQREAVLHTDGPLLIFAGAGSGKTRVLTHRITHLIQEHGVSPWNIFAVTFTNKAAGEMKERIHRLLGGRADDVWISTFHSAGLKILRRCPEKIGLGPFFTILDDGEQLSLLKEGLEALQINPKVFNPKAIAARIHQAKNELVTADAFALQADDFFSEKVALLYSWYTEALRRNNSVDFGDLILLPVLLFEKHPELLKEYQQRFRYLLVDEYQDTNHAQYRLIKLLSQAHQNLCVVGDDDQSIYRWRGADLRNILDFELDFPSAQVIKLEQNYRSTQTILKAASEVVRHIEERKPKELWTENEEGEKIVHFTAKTEKGEALFVVREIERLMKEKNLPWNECAIFYRTNAQSRVIEDELRKANIPYVIIGGTRFYDRMEIKDLLAYLQVIANPANGVCLKRIINVPARGIGKTSVEKIDQWALQKGMSFFEALKCASEAGLSGKALIEIKKFIHMIERFQTLFQQEKLSQATRQVLEDTGYLQELKNEKTTEAQDRIENLEELITVVSDYEHSTSEPTLGGFLDQISLASDVDKLTDERGMLPLMTLHMAKGLEYNYVFLMGLEEGLFPHTRSLDTPEEMDEERRLMYVGITRACKKLFLTHARQRSIYGNEQWNIASRFLDDIPPTLKEHREEGRVTGSIPNFSPLPFETGKVTVQVNTPDNPYWVGRKVKHPVFGVGTIRGCEGNQDARKLMVVFENGETKRLIAKYSNLHLM